MNLSKRRERTWNASEINILAHTYRSIGTGDHSRLPRKSYGCILGRQCETWHAALNDYIMRQEIISLHNSQYIRGTEWRFIIKNNRTYCHSFVMGHVETKTNETSSQRERSELSILHAHILGPTRLWRIQIRSPIICCVPGRQYKCSGEHARMDARMQVPLWFFISKRIPI